MENVPVQFSIFNDGARNTWAILVSLQFSSLSAAVAENFRSREEAFAALVALLRQNAAARV